MKTEKLKKWIVNLASRFSKVQLLSILFVVVFAFFVGDSNVFTRVSNDLKISELQKQIKYYREETDKNREKLMELKSSKDNVEKFARENYLMKKPDEDIFIVE
jgi:cell division protein FtsB